MFSCHKDLGIQPFSLAKKDTCATELPYIWHHVLKMAMKIFNRFTENILLYITHNGLPTTYFTIQIHQTETPNSFGPDQFSQLFHPPDWWWMWLWWASGFGFAYSLAVQWLQSNPDIRYAHPCDIVSRFFALTMLIRTVFHAARWSTEYG